MRKIAVIFAILLMLGIFASSCRTTKPPCPAYSSTELPVEQNNLN